MNNLLVQLNFTEIGIVVAIMAVLAIAFAILILLGRTGLCHAAQVLLRRG